MAQAIVENRPEWLTLEQLRRLRLAPWAHHVLGTDDPRSRALKLATAPDFAANWRHQLAVAGAMARLLRRWSEAGIDVLVFKGFAMAQLVYPHPAMRVHGDVDILIDRKNLARLIAVALDEFPSVRTRLIPVIEGTKSPATLVFDEQRLQVDVHVEVGDQRFTGVNVPTLTQAAWRSAMTVKVCGENAFSFCSADSALFGLAVNRGWSLDQWGPRPSDLIDLRYLVSRHGLTEARIVHRAAELGLADAWGAYATHCSPFVPSLKLRGGVLHRTKPELTYLPHDIPPRARYKVAYFLRQGVALWDCLIVLPHLVMTVIILAQSGPPARVTNLRQWMPRPIRSPDRYARGVRIVCRTLKRVLDHHPAGFCAIQSATLFRALATRGYDVQWIVGFRLEEEKVVGHAWTEINGVPACGFGDDQAGFHYRESYRSADRSSL